MEISNCIDKTLYSRHECLAHEEMFMTALFHDEHIQSALKVRATKRRDGVFKEFYNKDLSALRYYTPDKDIYVGINPVKRNKRGKDNTYAITCIGMDLDGHECPYGKLPDLKKNTLEIIRGMADKGIIADPNIIVDTGRGLAIYWILDRSIPCIESAGPAMRLYDVTSRILKTIIEDELRLCSVDTLEVDASVVGDISRVMRLPGTCNQNNKAKAHIIHMHDRYFNLREIVSDCEFDEYYEQLAASKQRRSQSKTPGEPLSSPDFDNVVVNHHWISYLRNLQAIRNESGAKQYRDIGVHIILNVAKCYHSYEDAVNIARSYNSHFSIPLDEKELNSIIDRDGRGGIIYKYGNTSIITKMAISPEEKQLLGLNVRQDKKQKTVRQNKKERDDKIVDLLKNSTKLQEEIAVECGVSVSTVKRIAKRYHAERYDAWRKRHQMEKTVIYICNELDEKTGNIHKTNASGKSVKILFSCSSNNQEGISSFRKDGDYMYNATHLRIENKNNDFICNVYPCDIIDENDILDKQTLIWDTLEQELEGIMTEVDDDLIDYSHFGIDMSNRTRDIMCYLISANGKEEQIRKYLNVTVKDLDRMRKHIHEVQDPCQVGGQGKRYFKKMDHIVRTGVG